MITFRPMTEQDIPLYLEWATREHVKSVWFVEGYEPPESIHKKIEGNGYDFPYMILLDKKPIGYIMYSDVYVYRTVCKNQKGAFLDEPPGTFSIDLFIGEESLVNKGYGSETVRKFTEMLFAEKGAKRIVIDPSSENKRAIRCYEKAGFTLIGTSHDGVEEITILEKRCPTTA